MVGCENAGVGLGAAKGEKPPAGLVGSMVNAGGRGAAMGRVSTGVLKGSAWGAAKGEGLGGGAMVGAG